MPHAMTGYEAREDYRRARRRRLLALGQCPSHPGQLLAPGYTICQQCLDYHHARYRARLTTAQRAYLELIDAARVTGAWIQSDPTVGEEGPQIGCCGRWWLILCLPMTTPCCGRIFLKREGG